MVGGWEVHAANYFYIAIKQVPSLELEVAAKLNSRIQPRTCTNKQNICIIV